MWTFEEKKECWKIICEEENFFFYLPKYESIGLHEMTWTKQIIADLIIGLNNGDVKCDTSPLRQSDTILSWTINYI